MEEIQLTKDQQFAYDRMKDGYNIFLDGDAGTGKSFVLNKFINDMKLSKKNIVVVAPTGIAATNINGVTFHRAFAYEAIPLVPSSQWRVKLSNTLKYADIIIIDEISMIRRDAFDLFALQVQDVIKKREKGEIGGNHKGIQIIVCGDFNQLPPVMNTRDLPVLQHYIPDIKNGYCFMSPLWKNFKFVHVKLNQVIRQKDENYVIALRELKKGNLDAIRWFNQSITTPWDGETLVLCATNKEVEEINKARLDKIDSKEYTYEENVIKYSSDFKLSDSDRHNDAIVMLKVGARVMSLINDKSLRFQNGSVGTIVGIDDKSPDHAVTVKFDGNPEPCKIEYYSWKIQDYEASETSMKTKVVAEIEQIPLKLAYALTIHKSQGKTYDHVAIKPDKIFTEGQLLVALSRCTKVENMQLASKIETTRKVVKNYDGRIWEKDFPIKIVSQDVVNFYNSIDSYDMSGGLSINEL